MRTTRAMFLVSAAGIAVACGSIPSETSSVNGGREVAPAGVMQGTVVYSGPHPCSSNGHIVGAAILFVFDRRNPPPPNGLAATPVNFGVVTGDMLFPDEPRNSSASTYCPSAAGSSGDAGGASGSITVSAPFTISPVAGGSYLIQAFYDYTGDFLPTFKFRDLPEKGDIGGGDIDTADALKAINAGNPNYQPHFLPVDIGTPLPLDGGTDAEIPNYVIPSSGAVVAGLTVTVGAELSLTRPYFYPGGMQVTFDTSTGAFTAVEAQTSAGPPTTLNNIRNTAETNKYYDPILTIPQDIQVLAAPNDNTVEASVNNFEAALPRLLLHGGLPAAEYPAAVAQPFHFQLSAAGTGGFAVWQNALFDATSQTWAPQQIPEGGGIPSLWPLVVLTKLVDDPTHTTDPSSITQQGDVGAPVVILQGITLLEGNGMDPTQPDSLFNTASASLFGDLFDTATGQPTVFPQDHLTVLLRPAVICFDTLFDPTNPDKRGTLVLPHLTGTTADVTNPTPNAPIIPPSAITSPQLAALVDPTKTTQACMPTGRYAINLVYPDGQAWTVPNESGACSAAEGATNYATLSCTVQPRPVLPSQGTRAVVEIVPAANPANCAGGMAPPPACAVTAAPSQ